MNGEADDLRELVERLEMFVDVAGKAEVALGRLGNEINDATCAFARLKGLISDRRAAFLQGNQP